MITAVGAQCNGRQTDESTLAPSEESVHYAWPAWRAHMRLGRGAGHSGGAVEMFREPAATP